MKKIFTDFSKLYILSILSVLLLFCFGCPAKPMSDKEKKIARHLVEMKRIKKIILKEIANNNNLKTIDEILHSISKQGKKELLKDNIEDGYYIINPNIEVWKNPSQHKLTIVIYCKTNLYSKESGKKYYAGTLGTLYYPLKTIPAWEDSVPSSVP